MWSALLINAIENALYMYSATQQGTDMVTATSDLSTRIFRSPCAGSSAVERESKAEAGILAAV